MKKRIIILFLLVCLMMCFSACTTNTKTSTKTIENDIIELVENFNLQEKPEENYIYDLVELNNYKFVSSNIIKRQTNQEEKEDVIYLEIVAQNSSLQISFNQKMSYTYYDEGGWILEDSSLEEINQITPIAAPQEELITKTWVDCGRDFVNQTEYKCLNDSHFSGVFSDSISQKILNIEFDKKEKIAKLYMEITSSLSTSKGYIPLKFDDKNGWISQEISEYDVDELTFVVTELKCGDYGSAIGVFEEMASPILKTRMTVHSIDVNNGTRIVSIDYDFVTGVMEDYTESHFETSFNPVTGSGYNGATNTWASAKRIS